MFSGPETVDNSRGKAERKHRQSRVHKTYCFPEVSVNKYFIVYQESKKRKIKANFIRKYLTYFINFQKNAIITKHSQFSVVQRSHVHVMAHVIFFVIHW